MDKFCWEGDDLLSYCEEKAKLKCRRQVDEIVDLMRGPFERGTHAPALFGCKMTGKTTIMQQAIVKLRKMGIDAFYIEGDKCPSIGDLTFAVRKAAARGFRHFIIDEVTQVKGFGEDSEAFKGIDMQNVKFVFSGTNSLLLRDIYDDEYVGWGRLIPTAPISFGEWCETHGIDVPVEEFLCNGGTMERNFFQAEPRVQKYVFSSCGKSLEKTVEERPDSEYRSLFRMGRTGILPVAVNFVVKDIIHSLLRDDIDERLAEFDSGDRKILSRLIERTFLNASDDEMREINRKFMNAYRARVGDKKFFRDDAPELNQGSVEIIMDALVDVDFIREWPVMDFLIGKKGAIETERKPFLLTLPCVRYRLTLAAAEEAKRIIGVENFPEKKALQELLSPDSYGSLGTLLEESVFLDMRRAGGNRWNVFKARFFDRNGRRQRGEIDIVIQSPNGEHVLLEVKHAKEFEEKHAERLVSRDLMNTLEMNGIYPVAKYLVEDVEEDVKQNEFTILSAKKLLTGLWREPESTLASFFDRREALAAPVM